MKTAISIEPDGKREKAQLARLGDDLIEKLALAAGHRVVHGVIGRLLALGCTSGEQASALVVAKFDINVHKVPCRAFYETVIAVIEEPPEPDRLGGRELSNWVPGEAAYPVMWLYSEAGQDFHGAALEDQQWFLALAAEVLYGVERDNDMLAKAVLWSKEEP